MQEGYRDRFLTQLEQINAEFCSAFQTVEKAVLPQAGKQNKKEIREKKNTSVKR